MGLLRIPLCFMVQLKTKPLEGTLICILEFFEIPGPSGAKEFQGQQQCLGA